MHNIHFLHISFISLRIDHDGQIQRAKSGRYVDDDTPICVMLVVHVPLYDLCMGI